MISAIDVGMYSLLGLFLLALDTRLAQRGVWKWLMAKALALRSEVRLLAAWAVAFVFRPDPPIDPKDVPPWRPTRKPAKPRKRSRPR